MVDTGYGSWSCTIPPINNGVTYQYIQFSEWMESMRKDVKCTFGIMKGRIFILRYGIRLNPIKRFDQLRLTCCVLHNLLLFVDELHEHWLVGDTSIWGKEYTRHKKKSRSFAIQRLYRNSSEGSISIIEECDQLIGK